MLDGRLIHHLLVFLVQSLTDRRVENLLFDFRVDRQRGADLLDQVAVAPSVPGFLELFEQSLDFIMIGCQQFNRILRFGPAFRGSTGFDRSPGPGLGRAGVL